MAAMIKPIIIMIIIIIVTIIIIIIMRIMIKQTQASAAMTVGTARVAGVKNIIAACPTKLVHRHHHHNHRHYHCHCHDHRHYRRQYFQQENRQDPPGNLVQPHHGHHCH